jgi:hypothetical protein
MQNTTFSSNKPKKACKSRIRFSQDRMESLIQVKKLFNDILIIVLYEKIVGFSLLKIENIHYETCK